MKYYFNNYLYSFASELSDNIDFIISNNPTLESQIKNLPIKYKKWLADRFGKSPSLTEIHPIQDCLFTLKKFSQREDSISAKYNSNQQFKNDIDNEFPPSDRGWLNPADSTLLSIDNMERILSLSEKKKTKVKLDTTTSYESDRVGKVGSWNIWLPSTQQNSINIAGYDPETNIEYTTWCTARIGSSNLFYNYVKPNFMLFYVIKDNPSGNNDWLSIGVENGEIIYRGDGAETINRDNIGLTEESIKTILGKSTFEQISSIILDKYESLSGQSPCLVKIKEAAESLDKLKEMVRTNSKREKYSFYQNLLINYEVSEEILEYLSNNNNSSIRDLVVQKTNNQTLLEKLAEDESPIVRRLVVKKINNEKLLEKLSEDEDPLVRAEVAIKTNNQTLLEKLAEDESPIVRRLVVKKINNEKLLEKLSEDENESIRSAVAIKTNNQILLEKLAEDESPIVRMEVLKKSLSNEKLLQMLANDTELAIRTIVSRKTNNQKLLEQLANDAHPDVRESVAENNNTNENLLNQLVRDNHPNVIVAALKKIKNEKLLKKLSRHIHSNVRAAALIRLKKLKNLKIKASSNKINQILKKATLYYKLTNNYFN